MTPAKDDIRGLVFDPKEVSDKALEYIDQSQRNLLRGVSTGVPAIDKVVRPLRPGELVTVLGYTHHYKSGFMEHVLLAHARGLLMRNMKKHIVVTFTWEQSVEELGLNDLASYSALDIDTIVSGKLDDKQIERLREAADKRSRLPWWIVGHSVLDKQGRPRMSMEDVRKAMLYLRDEVDVTVACVSLDYLQRMARPGNKSIREGFIDNVDACKDLPIEFNVPVMLGCQAGRQTKTREWRLPRMDDGQETSNVEQSSDKIFSLWMPIHDYADNTPIQYGSTTYTVKPNLLIVGLLKQKIVGGAPAYWDFHINFDNRSLVPVDHNVIGDYYAN